jgi:hypothetical protein
MPFNVQTVIALRMKQNVGPGYEQEPHNYCLHCREALDAVGTGWNPTKDDRNTHSGEGANYSEDANGDSWWVCAKCIAKQWLEKKFCCHEGCSICDNAREKGKVSSASQKAPAKPKVKSAAAPKEAKPKVKRVIVERRAWTEGEPTADDYRLPAEDIREDLCQARVLLATDVDKRFEPAVYPEHQCRSKPVAGGKLCRGCLVIKEKTCGEDSDTPSEEGPPKKGKVWHGYITGDPMDYTKMLGTEWAERKCRFKDDE